MLFMRFAKEPQKECAAGSYNGYAATNLNQNPIIVAFYALNLRIEFLNERQSS